MDHPDQIPCFAQLCPTFSYPYTLYWMHRSNSWRKYWSDSIRDRCDQLDSTTWEHFGFRKRSRDIYHRAMHSIPGWRWHLWDTFVEDRRLGSCDATHISWLKLKCHAEKMSLHKLSFHQGIRTCFRVWLMIRLFEVRLRRLMISSMRREDAFPRERGPYM